MVCSNGTPTDYLLENENVTYCKRLDQENYVFVIRYQNIYKGGILYLYPL